MMTIRTMLLPVLLSCALLAGGAAFAAAPAAAATGDWTTYYEASHFKRTPPYKETIDYCRRLAAASPQVHYTTFGTSAQGRDLPLLIVDKDGASDPDAVRKTGRAVVLVQAGIHAGEIDGKDAGLMLVRDMVIDHKFTSLLDHVTLLFIPIYNVDGHERSSRYNRINQNGPEEMGWRVTANNLNLNRDYLKADAPATRAWLRLYTRWLPEFLVDCHVTDGADYQYAVTYEMELFGNMDEGLTDWAKTRFVPDMEARMKKVGFPTIPYQIYRRRGDPRSGLVSWVAPPGYSQGYAALQNRPTLLIETHMLKDYHTRVSGTYEMLRTTLDLVGRDHQRLRDLTRAADERAASPAFRRQPFPLTFTGTADSVMIDYLGVEYHVVHSDLTGGPWIRYTDKPVEFKIPYFNVQKPVVTAMLPEAYIVPRQWSDVIDLLALHGVAFTRTTRPVTMKVHSVRFLDPKWAENPHEGRHRVSFKIEPIEETRTFVAGSAVVDMNQRAARVAAHILEPEAPESCVSWGFFDAVFEQKEYFESYVMEGLARKMLKEQPGLRGELDAAMAADSTMAHNPRRILDWFYRRSPYWDNRYRVYPVAWVTDRALVRKALASE